MHQNQDGEPVKGMSTQESVRKAEDFIHKYSGSNRSKVYNSNILKRTVKIAIHLQIGSKTALSYLLKDMIHTYIQ